jgi:hypothetical protein
MLSPLAARVAMRRREFISVLGGAAATWSFAVRAQQPERIRRVSILLPATADDAEFQTWIAAFHQAMALLGWNIGRNLRVDTRWATSNAADIRRHASELAASAPDVILAHGAATLAPLLQVTRTVPTVFVVVTDPARCDLFEQLQPFCHSPASASHSGTICRCSWHPGEYSAELGATPQKTIGRGSHVVAIDRAKAGIAGSVADCNNVIATE